MDEESEIKLKQLSLIDVSFEDDCLIDTSRELPVGSENRLDQHIFELVEAVNSKGVDDTREPCVAMDQSFQPAVSQLIESCESEGMGKNEKYNLRKSLAWDSAFFTSAGVLEPEELTSMIEGVEKKAKHVLPSIEEEIHRSTDSISTLDSDCLSLASLEADLFEDIRASIQKASKASNKGISSSMTGLLPSDRTTTPSSKKVDAASHGQLRPKPTPKKPSLGAGRTVKKLPIRPQIPQAKYAAANAEPVLLPSRPLKVGTTISAVPSNKRDSVGTNNFVKAEKNTGKQAGKATSASKSDAVNGSGKVMPRTFPSSRCSSGSTTARADPTSSCSSLDSLGSAPSDKTGKSPLACNKKNIDSRSKRILPSGSNMRTPAKGSKSRVSHLSTYVMSTLKVSSSISPASSISEWSAESSSSTSTVNQRSDNSSTSVDVTGSHRLGTKDSDTPEASGLQKSSNNQLLGHEAKESSGPVPRNASAGALISNSMKPSGLRMPSPKIGFFDGMKSGRTPNGARQSHSVASTVSTKAGAQYVDSSGGLRKGIVGKIQPEATTTRTRSTKGDIKQFAFNMTPKSLQEPPNAAMAVLRASRNVNCSPGISTRGLKKVSPKHRERSLMKAEDVRAKGCDASFEDMGFGISEKNAKDCPLTESLADEETLKSSSLGGEPKNTYCEIVTNAEKKACSEEQVNLSRQELAVEKLMVGRLSPLPQPIPELLHLGPHVEVQNSLSKLSPSPCLSIPDITGNERIPFSAVDSFYNRNHPDVSAALTMVEIEKSAPLSSAEAISKENC